MAKTYEPIATQTLGSSTTAVQFSSIPQTYTDLVLVMAPMATSDGQQFLMRVGNGGNDTGSNYSMTILTGNGSSATSIRGSNRTSIAVDYYGAIDTTAKSNYIVHFQNYSNTTTNKTILLRSNTGYATEANVALWRGSNAAIDTISVFNVTFATGSTFTLYGIKAA